MLILAFTNKKYEFVIMYKVITLIVQEKCTKYIRVYKLTFLIGFEFFLSEIYFIDCILLHQPKTFFINIGGWHT